MNRIRFASPTDLDDLLKLSIKVGKGMTSMPNNPKKWIDRLADQQQNIESAVDLNKEASYLLVLEQAGTGKIIGTSGLISSIGQKKPFYNYKIAKHTRFSERHSLRSDTSNLNLVNDLNGSTELVSLYVSPDHRVRPAGQVLSRSRFMLINNFPERFNESIFAEIRGVIDESGRSPFWDSLGRTFFGIDFDAADFISATDGSQFISDLMPHYPICVEMLPSDAQEVVAQPNPMSYPAMRLLEKEGFRKNGLIDIFDGGPVVAHDTMSVESVKQTRNAIVAEVRKLDNAQPMQMVSNMKFEEFVIICTQVQTLQQSFEELKQREQVALSVEAAEILGVTEGDPVSLLTLR